MYVSPAGAVFLALLTVDVIHLEVRILGIEHDRPADGERVVVCVEFVGLEKEARKDWRDCELLSVWKVDDLGGHGRGVELHRFYPYGYLGSPSFSFWWRGSRRRVSTQGKVGYLGTWRGRTDRQERKASLLSNRGLGRGRLGYAWKRRMAGSISFSE